MKRFPFLSFSALLFFLIHPFAVFSEEVANVIIVVDSSGSMAAAMENKTKMDVAKEVLSTLVGQLPTNIQTGLRAYGHRSRKDCRDTELLVPIEPLQADSFRQTVQGLKPLGQTPISYSLIQAAEDLKNKIGKKVVILISDGQETCSGDPCATAAAFKQKGAELQIHVVGFDIADAKAKKQLSCIAEATGGLYLDAKNSNQLLAGLKSAVEVTTGGGRLISKIRNAKGEQVFPYIDISSAASSDQLLNAGAARDPVKLPAGKYNVTYWGAGLPQSIVRKNIEIKEGQDTVVEAGGYGQLFTVIHNAEGKDVQSLCYTDVYEPGSSNLFLSVGTNNNQDLPPGIYDIRYSCPRSPGFWKRRVEIKTGQQTKNEFSFGRLEISLVDENGKQASGHYTEVYLPENHNNIYHNLGSEKTAELPAGSYDFHVWGSNVWKSGVEIQAGKVTRLTVAVPK